MSLRQNVRRTGALSTRRHSPESCSHDRWLDRILGRVTMYALVILCLDPDRRRRPRVLGAARADLESTPLALLASAAVLLDRRRTSPTASSA